MKPYDVYIIFFSGGMKVFREILWSRHEADFGATESSGFIPL